jgi:hypothetical protein
LQQAWDLFLTGRSLIFTSKPAVQAAPQLAVPNDVVHNSKETTSEHTSPLFAARKQHTSSPHQSSAHHVQLVAGLGA